MDHCPDWHSPPTIKGYRPDLHIWNKCSRITIIGEAKTEGDLMTNRSQKQINGFIDYLAERKEDAILILCVALNQVSDARYLIASNQTSKKITTHVIDRSKYEHHHAERL